MLGEELTSVRVQYSSVNSRGTCSEVGNSEDTCSRQDDIPVLVLARLQAPLGILPQPEPFHHP